MIARRLVCMLCILCITVWIALVATTGIAAATAFTVIPGLTPTIPEYLAYDQLQHGRLLAGLTVEPIFQVTDVTQWILAPASLLLVLLWNSLMRPPLVLKWINVSTIVIAIVLVACRWTIIDPPMNNHLESYRDAARSGDLEQAAAQLKSFTALHEIAEPMWGATGFMLLIGLASLGASTPSDRTVRGGSR